MAQTTGILNASSIRFFTGTVDGTHTAVANVTECSISLSTETRDISTKTSGGWREILPAMKSASINVSGYFAEDATNSFNALVDYQIAGTKVFAVFTNVGSGATPNVGDEEFDIVGYITSIEQTAGFEDNVTWSLTFEITGAVVREVIS
jgi:TP901-1 family phage major tail protein